MKEKLMKLFFKEEEILISTETMDLDSATKLIKKTRLEDKYKSFNKVLNIISIVLSILVIYQLIFECIYLNRPFIYKYIHDFTILLFYILTVYTLINNNYISKIYNISPEYLNKNIIKTLKKIFITLIFISMLVIHNIFYEIYCIFNFECYIYLLNITVSILLIIFNLIRSFSFLNKVFNKLDKIQDEMDGVV